MQVAVVVACMLYNVKATVIFRVYYAFFPLISHLKVQMHTIHDNKAKKSDQIRGNQELQIGLSYLCR